MKIFYIIILVAFIGFMPGHNATANASEENKIKQGYATVNLNIDSDGNITADSLRGEIFWRTLLDITNDGIWRIPFPLTVESKSVRVPMETLYQDGICLTIKDIHHKDLGTIVIGLNQNKPLNLTLHFDKANNLARVSHTGGTGNVHFKDSYGSIRMNFGSTIVTNNDDWESPDLFLKWQLESELPRNIKDAFRDVEISDAEKNWMTKNLTLIYCATRILPYEKRAKSWGVDFVGVDTLKIKQPPLTFFGFMNRLDYSSVMLNDFANSMRQVCNSILTDLPIGITPIGETPIDIWQTDVTARLKGIIDAPSQLLLDLLTATSYFNQIQYETKELSPVQVANVTKFYQDSDLGKIILERNRNPFPNIFPATD